MQFLSPAQLILVLWLIAAAAPVATVLINGALVPLAGAQDCQMTRAGEDASGFAASEMAAAWAVDGASKMVVRPARALIFAKADGCPARIPAISVLQTALQRHRPKPA